MYQVRYLLRPVRHALLLVAIVGSFRSSGAADSSAFLVKDINPHGSSGPADLRSDGGVLYFAASDGDHGQSLWRSDGTEVGTVPVPEPTPSALHVVYLPGMEGCSNAPISEVTLNEVIYFLASDEEHGCELRRTDGTESGTGLVKDVNPGRPDGFSFGSPQFATFDGVLIFIADDGVHGREVWRSDGTEGGTRLVKDINSVQCGSATCAAFQLYPDFPVFFPMDGTLFFVATDGQSGFELWKTDGTEAGTALVKDINPGPSDAFFMAQDYGDFLPYFTRMREAIYFEATDGQSGFELWKTDGTEAGTVLVKDINPGPGDSLAPPNGPPFNPPYASLGAIAGRNIFFAAYDGTHGVELWRSDGTEAGTRLMKDIQPGEGDSLPEYFASVDDAVVFAATDAQTGKEVWRSDGTPDGTVPVADIFPGMNSSAPYLFTVAGDLVFFNADDGVHGRELWAVPRSAMGSISSGAGAPAASSGGGGCALERQANSAGSVILLAVGIAMAMLSGGASRSRQWARAVATRIGQVP